MATKNINLSTYNKDEVPNAKELRFGIVVSQWNKNITDGLYKGAHAALIDCGVNIEDIEKLEVPGSFELYMVLKY